MIIKTNKKIVLVDVLVHYLIRIIGLIFLCFIINLLGNSIFEDEFNSGYLFSIALVPLVEIIKSMPKDLINPLTVKAKLIDNNISVKSGFYELFTDTLDINNIENIEYRHTLIGKIFGYETITIQNYGSYITIPFVKNSKELVEFIKKKRLEIKKK